MLKQYLGVSFMAQTVGTCYKDRTNCAFPAMAILGVVYAVFDPKGNLKWARDPEEFDEELTTKDTMKYVDIELCSSPCLPEPHSWTVAHPAPSMHGHMRQLLVWEFPILLHT